MTCSNTIAMPIILKQDIRSWLWINFEYYRRNTSKLNDFLNYLLILTILLDRLKRLKLCLYELNLLKWTLSIHIINIKLFINTIVSAEFIYVFYYSISSALSTNVIPLISIKCSGIDITEKMFNDSDMVNFHA